MLYKINSLGWICVNDGGKWVPICKLNSEQMDEVRLVSKVPQKINDNAITGKRFSDWVLKQVPEQD